MGFILGPDPGRALRHRVGDVRHGLSQRARRTRIRCCDTSQPSASVRLDSSRRDALCKTVQHGCGVLKRTDACGRLQHAVPRRMSRALHRTGRPTMPLIQLVQVLIVVGVLLLTAGCASVAPVPQAAQPPVVATPAAPTQPVASPAAPTPPAPKPAGTPVTPARPPAAPRAAAPRAPATPPVVAALTAPAAPLTLD